MFVGCLFLGIGIGWMFGQIGIGTMIGMGIGFIIESLREKKN